MLADASALRDVVVRWWRKETAPALVSGKRRIDHADLYPLLEFFHVVRDAAQIDLREDIPVLFRDLAAQRILGYYPAVWPAAENEYRIPWYTGSGDPDLNLAALTRAGEMALVAFESNAQEMQFLQGWLQHDRFVLRSTFGTPYEFLWGNPYQPGLPFEKLPLLHHDTTAGTLLARSSWEDDATWLGYTAGTTQLFRDGKRETLRLRQPLPIGPAVLIPGDRTTTRFEVTAEGPEQWFITGLKPLTTYDVETAGENMYDARTDTGGILLLHFTRRADQPVFVHEPRASTTSK